MTPNTAPLRSRLEASAQCADDGVWWCRARSVQDWLNSRSWRWLMGMTHHQHPLDFAVAKSCPARGEHSGALPQSWGSMARPHHIARPSPRIR